MLKSGGWACLLLLLVSPLLKAQAPQVEARQKLLQEEQLALERARADLDARRQDIEKRLKTLDTLEITPLLVEQARLDMEAARIQLEGLKMDIAGSQRTIEALEAAIAEKEAQIQELQSAKATEETQKALPGLKEELAEKKALLDIEKRHLANLEAAQKIAAERLDLAKRWYEALKDEYQKRQQATRKASFEETQLRLQKEQQHWLEEAARIRKALEKAQDRERLALETRLLVAEERARLAQLALKAAQVEHQQEEIQALPPTAPPQELKGALDTLEAAHKDLAAEDALWRKKIKVFGQQLAILQKTPAAEKETRLLSKLLQDARDAEARIAALLAALESQQKDLQARYEESVRRGLLARRPFPKDMAEWQALLKDLAGLPWRFGERLFALLQDIALGLSQAGGGRIALLILLEAIWAGLALWRRRWLSDVLQRLPREEPNTLRGILRVMAKLLSRNTFTVAWVGGGLLLVWLIPLPPSDRLIATALLLTLLAAEALLNLAFILLREEGDQPRLYRQIRWAVTGGALLTAVTLLGHLMDLPAPVRDVLDRLFMLFLLLTALPALGVRRLVLEALEARFGTPYWLRAVSVVSLLLPLSILAASLCGILGYLNLARAIGIHLGWFLLVVSAWLLLMGLLRDGVRFLKNWVNLHTRHGLFWAQGIIDPLHRLARLALFLLAWFWLFRLYGWDTETPWVKAVLNALKAPLITLGGSPLSIEKLILAGLGLYIVIWLGRWVRELTFRWVYAGITDLGVRHSLAVFTQYAVVLLGLVILLKAGHIDLTALAIFAGALGVGLGFGLQNIANNFVSGILLLAERPLKVGDIVRIGDSEGEVTRIGIRSLTVRTWDYQEVIIPNADVISNAFTNWTHSDNIVRTTFIVGISYDDSPPLAQKVMLEALQKQPKVLDDPPPRVWLAEFADSSVNFWIQYYSDIRLYRRYEVRSEVYFALWNALKEAGITIPYPQRDIHIKSMP